MDISWKYCVKGIPMVLCELIMGFYNRIYLMYFKISKELVILKKKYKRLEKEKKDLKSSIDIMSDEILYILYRLYEKT